MLYISSISYIHKIRHSHFCHYLAQIEEVCYEYLMSPKGLA